jgi:hypothetical protein
MIRPHGDPAGEQGAMGRLSAKLRSMEGGIGFWCPGCDEVHAVKTNGDHAWQWDGNVDAPTISPSILITSGHYVSTHKTGDSCWCSFNEKRKAEGKSTPFKCSRCHTFVKAGQIEFLGDCTHALAGKTVPIPDWPYAEGEYGGV